MSGEIYNQIVALKQNAMDLALKRLAEIEAENARLREKIEQLELLEARSAREAERERKRAAALLAGLKEMIESGRLTEADIPDDFEWLCDAMAKAGRKVKPPQRP